ncbi:MAG: exodeoxyribonuclease III [Solirubrobacteraceae bacterium]
MRIVTWNVNSLRARLPRVLQFLAEFEPDVACLQETKCAPDTFPADELAAAGYGAVHNSGGQWAGVAVLARAEHPLSDPLFELPGDPVPGHPVAGQPVPGEARWCEATVDGIRFASVYVPNGRTLDSPEFSRKLVFLEAMAARSGALAKSPLVLAGDMNVAPADIDVYDPAAFVGSTHVTPEERGRLERILATGLVDSYRQLHPDEVQYTWWDYRAGNFHKGLGLRIDLALVSASLAPRLRACGMIRDYRKGTKPSDHAPLLLELA